MPDITGWDVARAVKARRPRLPVILLTGWGEQAKSDGGAAYVDRIFGKPVRMQDLLGAIAELCSAELEPPERQDATGHDPGRTQ
jgi:FixJ family two-component response regulator